jgi:hypothetical protein
MDCKWMSQEFIGIKSLLLWSKGLRAYRSQQNSDKSIGLGNCVSSFSLYQHYPKSIHPKVLQR